MKKDDTISNIIKLIVDNKIDKDDNNLNGTSRINNLVLNADNNSFYSNNIKLKNDNKIDKDDNYLNGTSRINNLVLNADNNSFYSNNIKLKNDNKNLEIKNTYKLQNDNNWLSIDKNNILLGNNDKNNILLGNNDIISGEYIFPLTSNKTNIIPKVDYSDVVSKFCNKIKKEGLTTKYGNITKIKETVGQGGNGRVLFGVLNKREVAIKVLYNKNNGKINRFKNEFINIMMSMQKYPNIVEMYLFDTALMDGEEINYIVMKKYNNSLDKAKKEVDFETDGHKLLIELYSQEDDILVFTITRYRFKKNNLKQYTYSKIIGNNTSTSTYIYKFKDFENFCDYCSFMSTNLNYKKIFKSSTLYFYNSNYYLVLSEINRLNREFSKFHSISLEFFNFFENSDFLKLKLEEYGKILIKNNAIPIGIKYFTYKKSTI